MRKRWKVGPLKSPPAMFGDAPMPPELLDRIPRGQDIGSVTADGAYDTRECRDAGAIARNEAVIASRYHWFGGSDLFPMFRWEVIEGRQRVAIFARLGHRFLVFHTGGFDEEVKGGVSFGLGFRLPDVM